ncbi:MAG: glutathione S-transferase, partial [Asticcacaulis sp.]|nr:glutathione S-transferase [Asticcacaulis sp.]
RDRNFLAPPELKAVHPLGKSPVVTDGDLTVAESGAIIDYLLNAYGEGQLAPAPGSPDRLAYSYWMYAAEGTFMTPLLLKLIADNIRRRTPFFVKPVGAAIASGLEKTLVTPNIAAHTQYWDDTLAKAACFAGADFTAADIMMSFPVETAVSRVGAGSKPNIARWLTTVHDRPAYRRALERGGPYAYA